MEQAFPLLETCRSRLQEDPFLGNTLKLLQARWGETHQIMAEQHLQYLRTYFEGDESRFEAALAAFQRLTYDSLRMQSQYVRQGKIAPFTADQRSQAVYRNQELMAGPYLLGLFLAQVFWPNHFEQYLYYRNKFLPYLTHARRLIDVGVGPGTHSLLARLAYPNLDITALDISPYAVAMAEAFHTRLACAEWGSFQAFAGDAIPYLADHHGVFEAAVFSEIVEHLDDPPGGLAALHQALTPKAVVFFSTATNAAFYDHTMVFHNIHEIESLLQTQGFQILDAHQAKAYQGETAKEQEVWDYFAILQPCQEHH